MILWTASLPARGQTRSDDGPDHPERQDSPARPGQPVPPPGVKTGALVDGDDRGEHVGELLRLRPRRSRQGNHLAIAVDHCRDAHVDGTGDGAPALDRSEATDGQVLLVLARS